MCLLPKFLSLCLVHNFSSDNRLVVTSKVMERAEELSEFNSTLPLTNSTALVKLSNHSPSRFGHWTIIISGEEHLCPTKR